MAEEILSTNDLAFERSDEGEAPDSDLTATKEPEGSELEFHISMRSFTKRDFYDLMVEAAARQIVGRHPGAKLAKDIEAKCVELIDARASDALAKVATDILDQPMLPSFGSKEPVTMREFIGLCGREYLTTKVDSDGKPSTSFYYTAPRIERIVSKSVDAKFKREIEGATSALIRDIQAEIKARHEAILAAEKKRLSEALAALGPK